MLFVKFGLFFLLGYIKHNINYRIFLKKIYKQKSRITWIRTIIKSLFSKLVRFKNYMTNGHFSLCEYFFISFGLMPQKLKFWKAFKNQKDINNLQLEVSRKQTLNLSTHSWPTGCRLETNTTRLSFDKNSCNPLRKHYKLSSVLDLIAIIWIVLLTDSKLLHCTGR